MAESTVPITLRGRYFWRGDERFLIKGVVYQLGGSRTDGHSPITDPLSDERLQELERSLPLFQELGLNALFIFSVDNTRNHDKAMKLLAQAGIYVLACVSTPKTSINRSSPLESYKSILLLEYFRTIDCMAAYPNTLGIIVANGVINDVPSTNAASVIRAVARDVKKYMAIAAGISGQRVLPIGVSASSVRHVLMPQFAYMTGGPQDDAIDFFSFNNYSWCGEASMRISGYENFVQIFSETHVPVFFSEYGANVYASRVFRETCAIYSPEMTGTFSGGCVYEFFEGVNRYGLVKAREDGTLEPLEDFKNLKQSMEKCTDMPETLLDWSTDQVTATKRPTLPESSTNWRASSTIPCSPVDWSKVTLQIEDQQWVDVELEMRELSLGGPGNSTG